MQISQQGRQPSARPRSTNAASWSETTYYPRKADQIAVTIIWPVSVTNAVSQGPLPVSTGHLKVFQGLLYG